MSDRIERIQYYLGSIDGLLKPLGFRRRSGSQEWTRPDGNDAIWVHLNVGRALMTASVGVRYLDIERRWGNFAGVIGAVQILNYLFDPPRSYNLDDSCEELVADLASHGLPRTAQMQNREYVVELLLSNSARDWPAMGLSDRIRLLPLLLIELGRETEAVAIMEKYVNTVLTLDQVVPRYDSFRAEVLAQLLA